MIILEFPNVDILEYLRKELVDHDRVENDDEHKGEEVAKDEETDLRKILCFMLYRMFAAKCILPIS